MKADVQLIEHKWDDVWNFSILEYKDKLIETFIIGIFLHVFKSLLGDDLKRSKQLTYWSKWNGIKADSPISDMEQVNVI